MYQADVAAKTVLVLRPAGLRTISWLPRPRVRG
jgi:hypothetical protein